MTIEIKDGDKVILKADDHSTIVDNEIAKHQQALWRAIEIIKRHILDNQPG